MNIKSKNLIGALSGNFLEYYDVTLYGFFASTLAPIFFPSEDPLTSKMLALGAFAIGFLARPFGGILFGYLGDRLGRKIALSFSVLLVTIPTFSIGLIPSYETIGVMAPLLVTLCRFMQGVSTGGEYSGVAVFVSENSSSLKKALFCSMVPASSLLGAVTGTTIGAFFMMDGMPSWGWRLSFLMGGILGIIAFFLRRQISETSAFETLVSTNHVSKNPFLEMFKSSKILMFGTIFISAGTVIPFYLILVYMMGFMERHGIIISDSQRLLMTSGLMVMIIISFPIFGILADKYGAKKIMISSCLFMASIAFPASHFSYEADSLKLLFCVQALLAMTSAGLAGPVVSYYASLFPTKTRYSSMGFSISIGEGIGGGTTPLIALHLVDFTGNPLFPSFYLIIVSFIAILGIYMTNNALQSNKDQHIN